MVQGQDVAGAHDSRRGRSVDGGDSFNIMIFWADPVIRSKFPGLALVFNMVYGAVSHEATSESAFSGAGRASNKARTLVGSTTLLRLHRGLLWGEAPRGDGHGGVCQVAV